MSSKIFPTAQDAENAFYEALERADLEGMMAVWSEDEEIVCVHPAGQRLAGHPPRPLSKDDGVADPDFLRSNPRMGEIFDLSTLVAALRHPVTSLLVLLGLPITALGFSIAHGRRGLPVALRHQVALH